MGNASILAETRYRGRAPILGLEPIENVMFPWTRQLSAVKFELESKIREVVVPVNFYHLKVYLKGHCSSERIDGWLF